MSKSKKNITRKKLKMKGRGLGFSQVVKPKSQESSNKEKKSKPLKPILKTSKDFKPKTQKIKYDMREDKNEKKSASPKTEEELYKPSRKKTLETALKDEALEINEAW